MVSNFSDSFLFLKNKTKSKNKKEEKIEKMTKNAVKVKL